MAKRTGRDPAKLQADITTGNTPAGDKTMRRGVVRRGPPRGLSEANAADLLCVERLAAWVDAPIDAGAVRATPPSLEGYAQVRDPFGYLWAFRQR
jgi:hypothetical protein